MNGNSEQSKFGALHVDNRQRVDMAVFLEEVLYRTGQKEHKAAVPTAIMHDSWQRIQWLRETYAEDITRDTPKFYNWKADSSKTNLHVHRILRGAADGIYSDTSGNQFNIHDLIEHLEIPYPIGHSPRAVADKSDNGQLKSYSRLPLEKQQLIDAVIFLDIAAGRETKIPRTEGISRRMKWQIAQQRELCAKDMESAEPKLNWNPDFPLQEVIDYALGIIEQSPNGVCSKEGYEGLEVAELVEYLDNLPYPRGRQNRKIDTWVDESRRGIEDGRGRG